MKLEDSQTSQNLKKAFLRESAAFAEYLFFAEQAQKEGLEQVFTVFDKFAKNEKAHATVWFKLYHGIADTLGNLNSSADLENYERTVMYKEFAKTAEDE